MAKSKKRRFEKIVEDIKSVEIQGARNVAKAAIKAYFLIPTKKSVKTLLKSRPTEPMMEHMLEMAESGTPKKQILEHFDETQEKINNFSLKLIKNGDIIFTHCHSSTVSSALINAHEKGKKFEIYTTETRPLFQGRKTARELKKAGIKVTMFVDSAMGSVLSQDKESGLKKVKKVFLGADALLGKGIINKIGSELAAHLAKEENIPFYIFADSLKFTKKNVPIEQRSMKEVWSKAPEKVKIKNPAFEFVPKKYIEGIVSEFGLMKYNDFVKKCKSRKIKKS